MGFLDEVRAMSVMAWVVEGVCLVGVGLMAWLAFELAGDVKNGEGH